MELTPEQLKEVEDYAGCLFTPGEIAIIMGFDVESCQGLLIENKEFKNAYQRGKLISEAAIRKSIIELAQKGSGPAQVLAMQLFDKLRLNEIPV